MTTPYKIRKTDQERQDNGILDGPTYIATYEVSDRETGKVYGSIYRFDFTVAGSQTPSIVWRHSLNERASFTTRKGAIESLVLWYRSIVATATAEKEGV